MKRILSLILAILVGAALAAPAQAQRVWRDGQWVTRAQDRAVGYPARSVPDARINPPGGSSRWGAKIGGRWHAGMRAPGGWGAYRRPVRGWTLPSYWIGGSFFLSDWSNWGLSRPPHGYNWVRYYDDAVLVDRGGRVWDSVNGLDWDGAGGDAYAYAGDGYAYAEAQGGGGGHSGYGASYAPPAYAAPAPRYSAPIPAQPYPGGYAPPPAYAAPAAPSPCGQRCAYGSGYSQGGYYAGGGGYYYTAPSTTTVVIQSAPVVTTTVVEEVIEEQVVTYAAPRVVRRAPVKRVKRVPRKSACGCQCVCR